MIVQQCTKVGCCSGEAFGSPPVSAKSGSARLRPPAFKPLFRMSAPQPTTGQPRATSTRQDDPKERRRVKMPKPRVHVKAQQQCARHPANSRSATKSLRKPALLSTSIHSTSKSSICISTSASGAALFSVFGRAQGQGSGYLLAGKTKQLNLNSKPPATFC